MIRLPYGFVTAITFLMNFIGDVAGVTTLTPTYAIPAYLVVILCRFFDATNVCFPQQRACIA